MATQITEELQLQQSSWFLIRVDGEEKFLVKEEDSAKIAIDSLANKMVIENTTENVRAYQRVEGDKKIVVKCETLGYVYNAWSDKHVIDYVEVPTCCTLKARLQKNVLPNPNKPISTFAKLVCDEAVKKNLKKE